MPLGDHAQDGLQGRPIGAVAVTHLIAEWKPVDVDDQREHDVQALAAVIAAVAAREQRIGLRRAFHVGAHEVIEPHVELGGKEVAIARGRWRSSAVVCGSR